MYPSGPLSLIVSALHLTITHMPRQSERTTNALLFFVDGGPSGMTTDIVGHTIQIHIYITVCVMHIHIQNKCNIVSLILSMYAKSQAIRIRWLGGGCGQSNDFLELVYSWVGCVYC